MFSFFKSLYKKGAYREIQCLACFEEGYYADITHR